MGMAIHRFAGGKIQKTGYIVDHLVEGKAVEEAKRSQNENDLGGT